MLGGCLKTIGCATLLLVAAGVAWITRDRGIPSARRPPSKWWNVGRHAVAGRASGQESIRS